MMIGNWRLGRRLDRLQSTVEQIRDGLVALKLDDELLDKMRTEQDEMERRIRFLEAQAGAMDPGGIKKEDGE